MGAGPSRRVAARGALRQSAANLWEEKYMTKLQMRRRVLLATAPALVAAPYVARAQTGKPEKSKVVLAVGGKSALYYLSLTIAEKKGFFKDAGLDVEINDFQGGSKSLEALMGGSADVVAGAYEHTIRMQQRGQPITGFALIGRGMQISIGVRNDLADKIKGPADIKGMKFGVSAPGSSTHMLLLAWAAKGGLKASDVTAIGTGAGATVVAAIDNKQVDGVSQTDPALTILQDKKLIKIMLDTRTMKGNQDFFGGAFPGRLHLCPAGLPQEDTEHRAGGCHRDRARRRMAADGVARRCRRDCAGRLSAGRQGDLREVVRGHPRDDLAGRHDAAGRTGELPEVPGRCRSEDRGRQGQDQARGHVDQRVRAARQEARIGKGEGRSWRRAARRRWSWLTSPVVSPIASVAARPMLP